jgi:hypothetical protein
MRDWRRIKFLNTYLAGTILPRVQLDFLTALNCAAHLVIVSRKRPTDLDHFIAAGAAMQRLWLTGTRLGLHLQPEMTPLIFAMYARDKRQFSRVSKSLVTATRVRTALHELIGETALESAVFLARIGSGPPAASRSLRLPLDQLIIR